MERVSFISMNLTRKKIPLKVAVTGAAGNLGYALVFLVASGNAFGPDQPVILHLIELPVAAQALKGVEMELRDSAFPLLHDVQCFIDVENGFKDVDYALLIGARPRSPGMERKDLLLANGRIFKHQAEALDKSAKSDTKVLVVGNPANTNAAIIATFSKKIKKENITCLTRLDQNRVIAQLSLKTGIVPANLRNAIIWGNHSLTQYPDIRYTQARIKGSWVPATSLIKDEAWIKNELVTRIQKRGQEIMEARKLSSAASAAASICQHLQSWVLGTPQGTYASMGVWSDGNPYGIKKGLIFSFPVICKKGKWEIARGFDLKDEFSKRMIGDTTLELEEELATALSLLAN